MGLLGACWQDEALIDDTFTEDEWAFLQTFIAPGPELCPPVFDDLGRCTIAAELGKAMFFDPALSGPILIDDPAAPGELGEAGKVSCATCHDPASFFIDTRSQPANLSIGAGAKRTKHNAMSPVNSSLKAVIARENCKREDADPFECGLVFSWTGKYPTAGEVLQIAGTNAMNTTGERLAQAIRGNGAHLERYVALFGGFPPVCTFDDQRETFDCTCPPNPGGAPCHAANPTPGQPQDVFTNVSLVLETYVRQLNSVGSPFDRYIESPITFGRTAAVEGFGDAERRGLAVFLGTGMCVDCHHGPLLSDLRFHNTGVAQIGPNVVPVDGGYGAEVFPNGFEVPDTRLGEFLTPPLRHVARTAPYMHAGQYGTLAEVIEFYRRGGDRQGFAGIKDGRIQPLEITDDEARDLEAFLRSLTGSENALRTWSPEQP